MRDAYDLGSTPNVRPAIGKKIPVVADHGHGLTVIQTHTLGALTTIRAILAELTGRLDAAEKRIAELEQPKKRQRRKVVDQ